MMLAFKIIVAWSLACVIIFCLWDWLKGENTDFETEAAALADRFAEAPPVAAQGQWPLPRSVIHQEVGSTAVGIPDPSRGSRTDTRLETRAVEERT